MDRLPAPHKSRAGRCPAPLVVALCLAGVAVSGYLAWTKLAGAHALFCTSGSGCDVVQASRYASLGGVPTALWGTGLYLAIGSVALAGFTITRWRAAFVLATIGIAFSAYLTGVSLLVLRATCGYCLASAVIMAAVLTTVVRHRAPTASLLVLGGATAAATVLAAVLLYAAPAAERTPFQLALAKHLARTHAVMYGAYWCPHCNDQKTLFGGAARALPYVECDPAGANARPDLCKRAAVKAFPTWVIDGRAYEGTRSLEELAHLSHFAG